MNTLPEWFTVEAAKSYIVRDLASDPQTTCTGKQLSEGIPMTLDTGAEKRLVIRERMDMRLSRRRVIWGVIALVVLGLGVYAVLPSVLFLVGVVVFERKWMRQAAQARHHLFFETNYEELLAACRTLSRRTVADESENWPIFNVYFGKRDPETLSFPPVILDLKPARVFTDFRGGGEVCIELRPGPDWFGVIALPEGSEGRGNVKLIEGLWYADSEYHDGRPQYMARINDMVEAGRRWRAAAQAQVPQPK